MLAIFILKALKNDAKRHRKFVLKLLDIEIFSFLFVSFEFLVILITQHPPFYHILSKTKKLSTIIFCMFSMRSVCDHQPQTRFSKQKKRFFITNASSSTNNKPTHFQQIIAQHWIVNSKFQRTTFFHNELIIQNVKRRTNNQIYIKYRLIVLRILQNI